MRISVVFKDGERHEYDVEEVIVETVHPISVQSHEGGSIHLKEPPPRWSEE